MIFIRFRGPKLIYLLAVPWNIPPLSPLLFEVLSSVAIRVFVLMKSLKLCPSVYLLVLSDLLAVDFRTLLCTMSSKDSR